MQQENNQRIFGELFLFLLVLSVTFFKFQHSFVEAQVQEQVAQVWSCLQNNFLFDNSMPPSSVGITLQGYGPKNSDNYAVLCTTQVYQNSATMTLGNGSICTTGYAAEDIILFGESNVGALSPATWQNASGTSKVPLKKDGSLSTNGTLYSPSGHKAYGFFAVSKYIPTPTIDLKNKTSLQLALLEFPTPTPADNATTCSEIRYDPYGVIFDSQSLEPLPNIQVTLLKDNNTPVSLPGLDNPSKPTREDGAFNFLANPGIYYMNPLVPAGYSFSQSPKINPNWSRVYTNLYHPGDPVDEQKGPVRKDIPLDPGTNKPRSSTPVIFEDSSVRLGMLTKFQGFISHPLSDVILVGKISGKEYARTTSDKSGYWEILLENSLIPQDENIVPQAIKAGLYSYNQLSNNDNSLLIGYVKRLINLTKPFSVLAQSNSSLTTTGYSPILTYIEGFAYGEKNNILPHASVYVKLDTSRKGIYYQTETDSNGFFSIPSQFLPIFPYHIEYTVSPNSVPIYVTTDQFVRENKTFLTDNSINLATKQKSDPVDLSTQKDLVVPKSSSVGMNSPTQFVSGEKQPDSNNENRSLNFMIILSAIFLLGIVLIGIIYFRIVKRNHKSDLTQTE